MNKKFFFGVVVFFVVVAFFFMFTFGVAKAAVVSVVQKDLMAQGVQVMEVRDVRMLNSALPKEVVDGVGVI